MIAPAMLIAVFFRAPDCSAAHYFVNDASTNGDVYAGLTGNDEYFGSEHCTNHNGRQCAKATVSSLQHDYHIAAGDTIYIDTGYYLLTNSITFAATNSGSSTNPLVIQGSTNFAAGGTILDRASTLGSDYAIQVSGATNIEFRDLDLRGGGTVVNIDQAQSCLFSNVTFSGGARYGCKMNDSVSNRLINCRIVNNSGRGLKFYGGSATLSFSVVAGNSDQQIDIGAGVFSMSNTIVVAARSNVACVYMSGGTYLGDYNLLHATNGAAVGYSGGYRSSIYDWNAAMAQDTFSLNQDPMFVDAANTNYHVKSVTGHYVSPGVWLADAEHSPCIDMGAPSAAFSGESDPNGGIANIGADGNTEQASLSRTNSWLMALSYRDGGTMRGTNVILRWRTNLTNASDRVTLEYRQDPSGTNWLTIATNVAATLNQYTWDTTGVHGSPSGQWRIFYETDPAVVDATIDPFYLRPLKLYVNDGDTNGDQYCTAPGSPSNWGASADKPLDSLATVVSTYALEYGDVVYMDNGAYTFSNTVSFGSSDSGNSNGYVEVRGGTNTVITRHGVSAGSVGIRISFASNVALENLKILDGYQGVAILNSSACILSNVWLQGATDTGLRVENSYDCRLSGVTVADSGGAGIALYTANNNIFRNCLSVNGSNHGVVINSSSVSNMFYNCTVASNSLNQIELISGSIVVSNSIIASAVSDKYLIRWGAGSYKGDYNDYFTTNGALLAYYGSIQATMLDWQAKTAQDSHSLNHDPLFADASALDFHLLSTGGRYSAGSWVLDTVHSPCIDAGATNAAYALESAPNGGRVNLGAYGNTEQASRSSASSWVLALSCNDEPVIRSTAWLRWTSGGVSALANVALDYSSDGGSNWVNITTQPVTAEAYLWDTAASSASSGALWRVVVVSGTESDTCDRLFAVKPSAFYINDSSSMGDVFCSTSGASANRGLRPDAPMNSLERLVSIYDFEAGDTIHVDTGSYTISNNIIIATTCSGSATGGYVSIRGSTNQFAGGTVLRRSSNSTGMYGLYLNRVNHFDLSDLSIAGGYHSVYMVGGESNRFRNIDVHGALDVGMYLESVSNCTLYGCTVWGNRRGLYINSDGATNFVSFSTLASNTTREIELGAGTLSLSNSIIDSVTASGYGIYSSAGAYTGDYNDLYATNGASIGYRGSKLTTLAAWQSASGGQDLNSLSHDPYLADIPSGEFHLRSLGGRYVRTTASWVQDAVQSPCIDTADPSVPVTEPNPNGGRANIGAYGNTIEASLSTNDWLFAISLNDGGTVRGVTNLTWRAATNLTGTVRLDYLVSPDSGWVVIATNIPAAASSYSWDTSAFPGSPTARWRVVFEGNTNILDICDATFALRPFRFYVNDGFTNGDIFCSATGSSTNSGIVSNKPSDSVQYIIDRYDLDFGDTIYIDTGTYATGTVTVGTADSGSSNGFVTLQGSTNFAAGGTVFARSTGADVVYGVVIKSAPYISMRDIAITGGRNGLNVMDSDHLDIYNVSVGNAGADGLRVEGCWDTHWSRLSVTNSHARGGYFISAVNNLVQNSIFAGNGSDGLYFAGISNGMVNSVVTDNGSNQFSLALGSAYVSNSIIVSKETGMYCISQAKGTSYRGGFNNLLATNGAYIGYSNNVYMRLGDWSRGVNQDTNSLSCDPFFVNRAAGDFHLRSTTPNGTFVKSTGLWTAFAEHSPCIDAGPVPAGTSLEPAPNGGKLDIGAYGGTEEASLSRTDDWITAVGFNDGGEARGSNTVLRWIGSTSLTGSVSIEYSKDNGLSWISIGTTDVVAGAYSWDISSITNQSDVLWRLSLVSSPSISDTNNTVFAVNPTQFYVNDSDTTGDIYTSAAGNVGNDGLSTNRPMLQLGALFATRTIAAGSTVYIDTGTYSESSDVSIGASSAGTTGLSVQIRGSTNYSAGGTSIGLGSRSIDARYAPFLYLSDLVISNGYKGISLQVCDYSVLSNIVINGMQGDGVYLANSDHCRLINVSAARNGGNGIDSFASDGLYLSGCTTVSNKLSGFYTSAGSAPALFDCRSEFNSGNGMYIVASTAAVSHCLVRQNTGVGISLNGYSNTVEHSLMYQNTNSQMQLQGGTVLFQYNITYSSLSNNTAFYKGAGSYSGDYNDFYTLNGARVGYAEGIRMRLSDWQVATSNDMMSVAVDPLFADPAGGDFHLQSVSGRYLSGVWINDALQSPCIDAGPAFSSSTNEPDPNGGRINIGLHGNTAEASKSQTNDWLFAASFNNGGTARGITNLRWRNGLSNVSDTVTLEYSRSTNAPWEVIATGIPATNEVYSWDTSTVPGSPFARWRIWSGAVTSTVQSTFYVKPFVFYVNDSQVSGDVYCSATGSVAVAGVLSNQPLASLTELLATYTLGAGDRVYVDTGIYSVSNGLKFGYQNSGTTGDYVVIQGSTNLAAGGTVFGSSSTGLNSRVFTLDGNSYLKIADVSLTGGYYCAEIKSTLAVQLESVRTRDAGRHGIFISSSAYSLLSNVDVQRSAQDGVNMIASDNLSISNSVIANNGRYGFNLPDGNALIMNATIASNAIHQILLNGRLSMTNSILAASGYSNCCIYFGSGTYSGDYNDFWTDNYAWTGCDGAPLLTLSDWMGSTGMDTHSMSRDPRFVSPAVNDFHLRSATANGTYVNALGGWTNFSEHSPCIDAGQQSDPADNEPLPNGTRINLGAYGNTRFASLSRVDGSLTVQSYTDGGIVRNSATLIWAASPMTGGVATLEYSLDNGTNWSLIAAGVYADDGAYSWNTTNTSLNAMWRISSGAITDATDRAFVLNPTVFYVNDASTTGDIFCAAAALPAYRGARPYEPAVSLASLLDCNVIRPGDTIYVDSGVYPTSNTVYLTASDDGTTNNYVSIIGNPDPTNGTVIAGTSSNIVFWTKDSGYMKLFNMTISNGYYGINLESGGHSVISNVGIVGSSTIGIRMKSDNNTVINSRIWNSGSVGISNEGRSNVIDQCVIYNSADRGLWEFSGSVDLRNTIVVAATGGACCVYLENGTYKGDYNDLYTTNGASAGYRNGRLYSHGDWLLLSGCDSNSLSHDPLFVDAASGDFHLRSMTAGGTYVNALGAWTNFSSHSPCIDAGPVFGAVTNEPAPNGGRINIGSEGRTARASLSITNPWVTATSYNDGGIVTNANMILRWLYGNIASNAQVTLEYYRGQGDDWQLITTNVTAGTGKFTWGATNAVGSPFCQWRLSAAGCTDVVDRVFGRRPYRFYVNDTSTAGDVYCSTTGTVGVAGVSSNAPLNSVMSVLNAYDFDGGDAIYIDTGTYALTQNVSFTISDSGVSGKYNYLLGSTNGTIFTRNTTQGNYCVYMDKASYWWMSDLTFRGGYDCIRLVNSDRNVFTNIKASAAANAGVYLTTSDQNVIAGAVITNNNYGITGFGNDNLVEHALIHANRQYGLRLQSDPASSNNVRSSTVVFNGVTATTNGYQLVLLGGTLRNCIMAASAKTYCLGPETTVNTLFADYNNYYTNSGGSGILKGYSSPDDWQLGTGEDPHSLFVDPLFVLNSSDFHLKSSAPNGTYVNSLHSWTSFPTNSPCIDTGDIDFSCVLEPMPNGGMIDMGVYGNTPEASKSIDTDGDGLSDTFETYARARRWGNYSFITFGTSPTLADSDGDGMSDYQEFVAGTDPLNPVQCFEMTNLYPVVSNKMTISWPSVAGKKYDIRVTTNLLAGFILVVSNIPATPPENHYSTNVVNNMEFYRINVSP